MALSSLPLFCCAIKLPLCAVASLFWVEASFASTQNPIESVRVEPEGETLGNVGDNSEEQVFALNDYLAKSPMTYLRVPNRLVVSIGFVLPMKLYTKTYGFYIGAGYRTPLLEFGLNFGRENLVWRQLEQKAAREILKAQEDTAASPNTSRTDYKVIVPNFRWKEGDRFEINTLELSAGANIILKDTIDGPLVQIQSGLILGQLDDSLITRSTFDIIGLSITNTFSFGIASLDGLRLRSALKYSIMEASKYRFRISDNQFSLQSFALKSGFEYLF